MGYTANSWDGMFYVLGLLPVSISFGEFTGTYYNVSDMEIGKYADK